MELRGATQSPERYKESLHGAPWSYPKSLEIQGISSRSFVELPKVQKNKMNLFMELTRAPESLEIQGIFSWSSVQLPKVQKNERTLFMELHGANQNLNEYKESVHGAPWTFPKSMKISSWSSAELPKVVINTMNLFMPVRGANQIQ